MVNIWNKWTNASIILASLFFTISIIPSKQESIMPFEQNTLFYRKLDSSSSYNYTKAYENYCSKGTKDLQSLYEKKNYETSFSSQKLSGGSTSKYTTYLINLIKSFTDDDNSNYEVTDFVKDYLGRVLLCIIFIILFVAFIICWIFYCCCICCKCCCFKKDKQQGKKLNCCKFTSMLLSIIFFGLVVVCGLIAIGIGPGIKKGINGTVCSLLRTVGSALDGEENCPENIAHWGGVDGIKDILDNVLGLFDQIEDQKQEISSTYNKYTKSKESLEYTGSNQDDVSETQNNMLAGEELFTTIHDIVAEIKTSELRTSIDEANESIEDIDSSISDIESEVLTSVDDYMKTVNDYSDYAFMGIGGVVTLFGVIFLLYIVLYSCCECCEKTCCGRCCFHAIWIILILFNLIFVLLGIVFGLLGIVFKDGGGVVSYILGENNLKNGELIFKQGDTVTDIISSCMGYGDKSLTEVLGLQSSGGEGSFDQLKDLVNKKDEYEEMMDKLDISVMEELIDSANKTAAQSNDNEQIKNNNEYLSNFNITLNHLYEGLSLSLNLTDSIFNIFSEVLGESNNIFDAFTCKFVGHHIAIVIDQITNELGKNILIYAYGLLLSTLFLMIGICSGIIVIIKFGIYPEKKNVQNDEQNVEVKYDNQFANENKPQEVYTHTSFTQYNQNEIQKPEMKLEVSQEVKP